jgi:hypothetical protein
MNEDFRITSINLDNKEFIVNETITYPILFDFESEITIEDFQKGLDKAKEIISDINE